MRQTNAQKLKQMELAIKEALVGRDEGGIPIGSILVEDGHVIGKGHNQRVQRQNPILHAEIDCLENAGRISSYRNTTLYSTLMPCYLCAGAIVQFGIPNVVVGENRNFEGAAQFLKDHGVQVTVLNQPTCVSIMSAFIRDNQELWNEDIGNPNENILRSA